MARSRWALAALTAFLVAAMAGPRIAGAAGPTLSPQENRGFTTQQRNHFGNPSRGFVVFDEWSSGKKAGVMGSGTVDGCARAFLAFKAKRVLLHRVQVRDAITGVVRATSHRSINSADAPLVQLCSDRDGPEASSGPWYFVEVLASIRWADGTLSEGVSFGSLVVGADDSFPYPPPTDPACRQAANRPLNSDTQQPTTTAEPTTTESETTTTAAPTTNTEPTTTTC